jgi:hypothetical protein
MTYEPTNCALPLADDTREITAELKSECEELRVQVELLTGEKDAAFEEIERLKDQVYYTRALSLRASSLQLTLLLTLMPL